jgi:iron complex outermembrane receptor protein
MKLAYLCGASVAAVTLASLGASPALAQAGGAQGAAAAAGAVAGAGAASANVVVTAGKRSQKIERVPVAISAFTAQQRQILGIKTVQQLSDFTPGLSYYAIADRAYIRGIGRNTVNLATESGVATYYNGVYYGANASIAQARDSLFIGQIEVDRGPQNTLHGSNSDGGVINYISARPTKDLYAEVRAGAQDYGEEFVEGAVSGPVNDNLRLRAGGMYAAQNGGFFNNLIGRPEGGYLPQGNGGRNDYAEFQFDTNIGHLDGWGMISTADYDTNFHTVATVGAVNDYEFANPAGDLSPGAFYGLCGLPGHGGDAGCAGGDPIVPGSVITAKINAAQFPGNNPSTANLHRFIETSEQSNRETKDLALATQWTYHFPGVDLQYIGGYQSFYYDLNFGAGVDAGVLQYKLAGNPSAASAGFFCGAGVVLALTGSALANCITAAQQPTTINPSQLHTSFIENEQYFSNEANLISTQGGPLQWIAGVYWYHEHFDQPIAVGCYPLQTQLTTPDQIFPFALAGQLVPAAPNKHSCTVNLDGFATYDSYAGYGQITYQIAPEWKFEAAGRYTDDRKEGGEGFRVIAYNVLPFGLLGAATPSLDVTPVIVPACAGTPAPGASHCHTNAQDFVTRTLRGSWNGFTGDATLTWTPDSETLAYLRYARGYKTGGFNSGTISAHPLTSPEYVDAVELGAKKTWGSMLQVNGAIFYYAYQNDQQPLTVQTAAGPQGQIFNIPSVHTYGVELEAVWQPIQDLVFTGTYSYLNATVASMDGKCVSNADDPLSIEPGDKTNGCGGLINLVGNTLAESPRNKLAFNAAYTWTFDPGRFSVSASVIWKDKTFGAIFNTPSNEAPAYSQVNLRATWTDAQNRYTVTGFVDNVFNTTGFDNVTEAQIAPTITKPSDYDIVKAVGLTYPLTFGIELQARFH